jgi:hypothetical protein
MSVELDFERQTGIYVPVAPAQIRAIVGLNNVEQNRSSRLIASSFFHGFGMLLTLYAS